MISNNTKRRGRQAGPDKGEQPDYTHTQWEEGGNEGQVAALLTRHR